MGIFATERIIKATPAAELPPSFLRGVNQAGYQTAALFITMGMAVGGGLATGLFMRAASSVETISLRELYNDLFAWETPSDYDLVGAQYAQVILAPAHRRAAPGLTCCRSAAHHCVHDGAPRVPRLAARAGAGADHSALSARRRSGGLRRRLGPALSALMDGRAAPRLCVFPT